MSTNTDSIWQSDDDFIESSPAFPRSQHAATPPHASPVAGEPPPRENPPRSAFELAFSNVVPAEGPSTSASEAWKAPENLREYWAANVPEILRRFPIPDQSVYRPVCMSPTEDQVLRMFARSKCMELLSPQHSSLLSFPTRAQPLCFVARAAEGLPIHIQKALFFFASVMHGLLDMSHFAAPTEATSVVHDRTDPKVIRSLVSTGQGMAPDPSPVAEMLASVGDGFINMDQILRMRPPDAGGNKTTPVYPLSIHVGFTGATFNDQHGKECREVFAVLVVTPSDNFALWPYIYEKFLEKPKLTSPKYDQKMELYLEATNFLREILRYECFCNLLADESKLGMPEDYRQDPGGNLGVVHVLSQFQIPFKIFNTIRTEHPNADFKSIRIVGCPELTFESRDEFTVEWVRYMQISVDAEARRQMRLLEQIDKYCQDKSKESFQPAGLEMSGGWPLETDDAGSVRVFGLPPLPLMHRFDANGARGSFSVFIASIGDADQALPDLTRAILTAFLVHSSPVDARPEIDHLLKDKRLANPLLVLRTYFGPDADPFSALVLANRQKMWAEALRTDIQVRRARGAPIQEVLRVVRDYLASSMKNLESMIECQVFRSATVTQMKAIHEMMDFEEACTGAGPSSIRSVLREKSQRVHRPRKHDSVFRAWNCFMRIWEEMNVYFTLNAGNLVCALEVLLSQIMSKFAHTNETWTFFFMTVVVMSGNGHFQVQTPDGPVPVRVKKNTTGMDYLLARLTDLQNTLYERLMIPPKDRHNIILNCMRFTATVWENLVTAQAAGGRLVAVPPSDANFQAMSLTEIRDSLKTLIQYGPPRGEEIGQTCSFNSQEMENKSRVASRKRKMGNNCIVVMASNVGSKNSEQKEEGNTLDAVCAVLPAGVPPPVAKRMRTEFNDMEANANNARHQPLENKDVVVNCIAYTANYVSLVVGLLNHIGAFSAECNPVVLAFYDWGCYYIKQFASSCMDVFVRDNFSRMKEGYKSRGVVLSLWLKTIHTLSLGKSKDQTAQHLWLDIHADALPLVMVPLVFSNLLYRGVHMGGLLMSNMLADHLGCPVVSLKNLNAFFEMQDPPQMDALEPGLRDDLVAIQRFVARCFAQCRFCPAEDGPYCPETNISCYITSDGAPDLTPVNPKMSLLRMLPGKDKDESQDITHKIALRVAAQYGETLNSQCHMGPEVSTYRLAVAHLLDRFAPDFRGLISPRMFYTRKHLHILGFGREAAGMADYVDPAPPPFARQFNIRTLRDGREQLQSQAVGVNLWSLLTVTALAGSTDLHPDVSNGFANSLLELILAHAPAACTPGDICPTSRFDHATAPTKLFISGQDRPGHFLRPPEPSFVSNGVLPIAKVSGRFVAEDMLHCAPLPLVAKNLHCDVLEVPANAFTVRLCFCVLLLSTQRNPVLQCPYALMPDTSYTFHVPEPDEGKHGILRVVSGAETIELHVYGADRALLSSETLDYYTWEVAIRERGMVITPLIQRYGAAVKVGSGLGCLIPTPASPREFLEGDGCFYRALISAELDVAELFFMDVLSTLLVPVGEVLYLDMAVLADEAFRAQGAGGKVLYTRLNVPHVRSPEPGKLYVTCLHQPRTVRGRSTKSATTLTFAVNPWDVTVASAYEGPASSVVKLLQ